MLYVKINVATPRHAQEAQRTIGAFLLNEQGQIEMRPTCPEGERVLGEMLADPNPIVGKNRSLVRSQDDPEGWMRALPWQYHGAYFNAVLVEEGQG